MLRMKIEGAHELQEALLGLPGKVANKLMMKALKAGAQPVLARAKSTCPVKSGALRDGLHIAGSNKKGVTTVAVQSSGPQYYGNMVERGTSRMKPHPWIAKAMESVAAEAVDIVTKKLTTDIEKEVSKAAKH